VEFTSFYIEEQPLIFSNQMKCTEPQGGLYLYGPYGRYTSGEPSPLFIDLGIIGNAKSVNDTLTFFEFIKNKIPAESVGRLDFPGVGIKTKLNFEIKTDQQWIEEIDDLEINNGKEIESREDRIDYFLDLFEKKIRNISRKDIRPKVILIALPMEIIKLCKNLDEKTLKIRITHRRFGKNITELQEKGDYDFHNIIKVFGMKYEIPTQMVLPPTFDLNRKRGVQDLATRAWNLSVALYYKAEGTPWKVAQLNQDTCYAGLSFYRALDEDLNPTMKASIAHLFLHTGECLVLTGEPFPSPEKGVEPYITKEQAIDLKELIINGYEETHGQKPKRVMIFKKSDFNEQEIQGFVSESKSAIKKVDLLTVKPSYIDWFRDGDYPPVRGTVLKCPGPEYLVYTVGFIPEMKTYPKGGIPQPLRVIPFKTSTNERQICKEILSLSKLNWNNINFSEFYPAPIGVSDTIGQILSESRAAKVKVSKQYRYYM